MMLMPMEFMPYNRMFYIYFKMKYTFVLNLQSELIFS